MLVQAMLLIAVIVVISGSLLTNAIVTARAGFAQAVQAQSRTSMSDATADFVSWAQARVRNGGTQASWRRQIVGGKSDSEEFRPICDPTVAAKSTAAACSHWEHNSWMVTGGTTVGSQTQPAARGQVAGGVKVFNLARTVDEQRITAVISVDVESPDGRQTYASDSREVTARIFDAPPWVVVTGVKEVGTMNGSIGAGEGDSGGFSNSPAFSQVAMATPNPGLPANVTDTRIITTVTCANSQSFAQTNPIDGRDSIISVGRDGDADWRYELPCAPRSPPTVPDKSYIPPDGTTYATGDNNSSVGQLNRESSASSFSY